MANSVEGRFPFLDREVVEFANPLPARHKLFGLDEKYLLKRAFADLVPEEIRRRPKQPYRAPDAASFFAAGTAGLARPRSPPPAAARGGRGLRPAAGRRPARQGRAHRRRTGMGNTDNMRVLAVALHPAASHEQFVATRRRRPRRTSRADRHRPDPAAASTCVDRDRSAACRQPDRALRPGEPARSTPRRRPHGSASADPAYLTRDPAQGRRRRALRRDRLQRGRRAVRRARSARTGSSACTCPSGTPRRGHARAQHAACPTPSASTRCVEDISPVLEAAGCYRAPRRRDPHGVPRLRPGPQVQDRAAERRSTPTASASTPWSSRRPTARRPSTG